MKLAISCSRDLYVANPNARTFGENGSGTFTFWDGGLPLRQQTCMISNTLECLAEWPPFRGRGPIL